MVAASIPLEGLPRKGPTEVELYNADPEKDFIFGPLEHENKLKNSHRSRMLHKLEPAINVYAKKLRQMYYREGTIQTEKTFIDPVRLR